MTLGAPRLELGSNPRVTALLAGRRSTVLTLAVAPVNTANGVTLETTGATLTAVAAKTLARRLRVPRLPRASFATVAADVHVRAAAPLPAPPAPGAVRDDDRRRRRARPRPRRAAGEGPARRRAAPWRVRRSPGTSATRSSSTSLPAKERASAVERPPSRPPSRAAARPRSSTAFHFSPTGGWCDPVTGAARLTFAGNVGFRYRDHEIDLRVNDPEIELDGPASRVIFRMTGSGGTDGGNRRSVVETLDVSRAAAVRVDGKTITYERIPAAVPPGAADSVFAGYYLPGDPFGWVSITLHRRLNPAKGLPDPPCASSPSPSPQPHCSRRRRRRPPPTTP